MRTIAAGAVPQDGPPPPRLFGRAAHTVVHVADDAFAPTPELWDAGAFVPTPNPLTFAGMGILNEGANVTYERRW